MIHLYLRMAIELFPVRTEAHLQTLRIAMRECLDRDGDWFLEVVS